MQSAHGHGLVKWTTNRPRPILEDEEESWLSILLLLLICIWCSIANCLCERGLAQNGYWIEAATACLLQLCVLLSVFAFASVYTGNALALLRFPTHPSRSWQNSRMLWNLAFPAPPGLAMAPTAAGLLSMLYVQPHRGQSDEVKWNNNRQSNWWNAQKSNTSEEIHQEARNPKLRTCNTFSMPFKSAWDVWNWDLHAWNTRNEKSQVNIQ